MLRRYGEFMVSCLKEAVLFNLAGVVVALAVLLLLKVPVYDSFGFIILIESTGLMLVGGALGVAGQATSRKLVEMLTRTKTKPESVALSDFKAGIYALTGVILFAEGAMMAVIFS